jgi:hypothetical protein
MENRTQHDLQPAGAPSSGPMAPYARRADVLDRRSVKVVDRARSAGVPIRYLGITPLFDEPRAYAGPDSDWVISPVLSLDEAVVPRAERAALVRLVEAGIEFPMVYIAHEVPKGRLAIPVQDSGPAAPAVNVDQAAAAAAVGPVPLPRSATDLSDRLGRSSECLLHALAMAVPIAAGIVAAPFVLAGAAAAAAVSAIALDPIVFGVIPAGRQTPGQPAAWYVLAQWDWPQLPA